MKILKDISAIMSELGAIGKTHRNNEQNYSFRAIDDIVARLNPILVKYSVVIVPSLMESESKVVTLKTRNGDRSAVHATARIEYTLYSDDGSNIKAVGFGEGIDYSDKGINKACTGAYKNMLCQTLVIPTYEKPDNEFENPEAPNDNEAEFRKLYDKLPKEEKDKVSSRIEQLGGKSIRELEPEAVEELIKSMRDYVVAQARNSMFNQETK